MAAEPGKCLWPRYRRKMGTMHWGWLERDLCYTALGETASKYTERYRDWVVSGVPEDEWQLTREAVQRGQLTGSECFRREVEQRYWATDRA